MSRKQRESRQTSTRKKNQSSEMYRKMLASGEWINPYDIPEHLKDPDSEYAWLNVRTLGEENEHRISTFHLKGYEPCDPEDFPDLTVGHKFSSRKERDEPKRYIEKGGNVLFSRDKDVAQMEARKLSQKNEEVINQLKSVPKGYGRGLFQTNIQSNSFGRGGSMDF